MEEFLTGELEESEQAVERRSSSLIRGLVPPGSALPHLEAQELAASAIRRFSESSLSEIVHTATENRHPRFERP